MNSTHLHLLLNHIPVLGVLFALALFALSVARRQPGRARDGLSLLVLLGVATVGVYLSGGAAEDAAEQLPGVTDALIESHEEAALAATIALGALAVMAAIALWRYRGRQLPRWIAAAGLAGTAVIAGMMAWTANLGGQIRHTEIRGAGAAVTAERNAVTQDREEGREAEYRAR